MINIDVIMNKVGKWEPGLEQMSKTYKRFILGRKELASPGALGQSRFDSCAN